MTETEDTGPLYDVRLASELEEIDRKNPIPGGEPDCPVCGSKVVRLVEEHKSLTTGDSPFRVRLVCSNAECRRWTVYDW